MEDDAALPRHAQVLVDIFAVEELVHEIRQRLFHILIQDHVFPIRLLYLIVQRSAHSPVTIIDIDVLVIRLLPHTNRSNQAVCLAIPRHRGLTLGGIFEDVLQLGKADLDDVYNEVFKPPLVDVFCKGASFGEHIRNAAAGVARVEVSEPLDSFIFDVEISGGIASGGELQQADCGCQRLSENDG